jgi:hypothetical protein
VASRLLHDRRQRIRAVTVHSGIRRSSNHRFMRSERRIVPNRRRAIATTVRLNRSPIRTPRWASFGPWIALASYIQRKAGATDQTLNGAREAPARMGLSCVENSASQGGDSTGDP